MSWKLIDELKDNDKIYKGTLIRFYDKEKAISEGVRLPIQPIDYIISPVYANNDYFQLTCLSKGEEGNITCVLKAQDSYILGIEIKRMLLSDYYRVLINNKPDIVVK